jgi:chemotaxis protein MotB
MVARKLVKGALLVAGLFVFASLVSGCGPDLQKENLALKDSLQKAQADNQDLTKQFDAAQAENGQLRAQLAKAPPPAQPGMIGRPMGELTGAKEKFGPGLDVTETAHAVTVTLPEAILFDSGKAVLKESSKATLAKVAGVIKKHYVGKTIRVEGHTDADPIKKSSWKDNWELSTERALAVVRDLTKVGGIEPKDIYAAGFGEHAPKAGDKAKNRRVEIVILK